MSMMRGRLGEIGTALAVLAIYLLTMLAPLHHARASQLVFEELGYTTIEAGWALCTPAGLSGEDRDDITPAKCPAAGIGKNPFVAPTPAATPVVFDESGRLVHAAPPSAPFRPEAATPPSGSRGPPVRV